MYRLFRYFFFLSLPFSFLTFALAFALALVHLTLLPLLALFSIGELAVLFGLLCVFSFLLLFLLFSLLLVGFLLFCLSLLSPLFFGLIFLERIRPLEDEKLHVVREAYKIHFVLSTFHVLFKELKFGLVLVTSLVIEYQVAVGIFAHDQVLVDIGDKIVEVLLVNGKQIDKRFGRVRSDYHEMADILLLLLLLFPQAFLLHSRVVRSLDIGEHAASSEREWPHGVLKLGVVELFVEPCLV